MFKDWLVLDEDELHIKELPGFLALKFPEEYPIIAEAIEEKNILAAVKRDQICYKKDISVEHKQKVIEAMHKIREYLDEGPNAKEMDQEFQDHLYTLIIEKAKKALDTGKNLIVDAWNPKTFERLEKYQIKVIHVLLHHPLGHSFSTFKKRNSIAKQVEDLREIRFWGQWLESIDSFYEFSTIKKDGYLSFVNYKDLEGIFNYIESETGPKHETNKNSVFSWREIDLIDLQLFKKKWLENHKFKSPIYLYPKHEYDLIITNDNEPDSLANRILQFLEENN